MDLLEKSILVYDQTTLEYDVKDTLEAIAAFLKKYPDLSSYHRDKIIDAIRKVNNIEFKHYVDEIKDLLKIKE